MSFLQVRRLAWDTETTSTDPTEARIVTAALVGRGGGGADRVQTWLINPGVPIPPETTAIHGVDDERAMADGQDPRSALDEIADTIAKAIDYGMPIVAYNTAYDWSVLHHELQRHGLRPVIDRIHMDEPYTLLDPLVIDKQCDRYRKGSRKLQTVAEHYGVTLTDWHTADADATAALGIADELYRRYPQLDEMGPKQLYAAQKAWRAEQQAGLQEYLRRTKPTAACDPAWPLIPRSRKEGQ
ncbi:DNA polymerase III subunit epsilon [Streptomyces tricolor]|uniref:DNA polymerase III subunit epsilon n=1 Tax=Streptomyces tricolor TaxID=68277 RepID=A0ABS9JLT5_9ACTN|nr:exonuclease domain-containing protein [Streptomyces tricolor]MCG0066527.1 DNA polymerase III subunit epsilon [Streptomyces tricolor]